MKKSLIALMSILALLSLFTLSSAAAQSDSVTIQVPRPSEDGKISVNGVADEIYWLLDTPVGDARLGALCDGNGLYLAFETQAETAEFTVNGCTATCTLGDGPTTSLGKIAGADGVYELYLTLAQFGMKPQLNNQVSFAATIGSDSVSGTLLFAQYGLAPTGTGKVLTGVDYHSAYKGDSTGNITVSEDGVFTFKNDGEKTTYSCYTKSTSDWANLSLPGLSMSFEADFNDLPSSTTRPNMHWFGFWWFIVGNNCRYDMAFWADADGQIRFTVHQDTDAAARDNALATGIKLGSDEAKNVRVRILVDTDHNVTLYLNGVRCGTLSANPGIPSGASSLGSNALWFYADHRNRASVDHSVDVTLSDLSVRELTATEARKLYSMGLVLFVNDDDPTALKSSAYASNRLLTFDTTHNSVVYDQGSAKRFNTVTLYDSDEFSRVSQNDLGLFVSTTGQANSWTKVTGWKLHQSGNAYTLYNIDETARYVKVHCYLDKLNDPDDPVAFAPSFTNYVADLMTVEFDPYLLGADSDFAHTAACTVSNKASTELRDHPFCLTLDQIGAAAGEYQADCSDFRFTMGNQQLPHWYDGEGSFYVRVPSVPASATAAILAHWGNADADDVSDREAVFEAVYGNASLIDLSAKTNLAGTGRAFTFPDGSIIAVGRDDDEDGSGGKDYAELTAVFSYDGGRTFTSEGVDLIPDDHYGNRAGFGSFIWDPDAGTKGRLILMAYIAKKTTEYGYKEADCRFVMLYTDDYGKTWSEPRVLSDAEATPAYKDDATYPDDIIIQNSQDRFYQLSYGDGLTLKDADGTGPNVDYVFTHGYFREDGIFAAAAIYSMDAGASWYASESDISMKVGTGHEQGISETGLAQLDDGSLYVVARAQQEGNIYLYESYSYDCGNTWTQAVPSKVISTNTSPVLLPYGDDRLLMWSGNNTLGGDDYSRFPMTLAISRDNYQTYERSLDLTLGTSFDTLEKSLMWMTQPSLSISPDGKEAFVCWTNLKRDPSVTVGVLLEEFDEMIYHTKGAYDAFESTSIKGEGWLMGWLIEGESGHIMGKHPVVAGQAKINTQMARTGSRSMSLTDDSDTLPAYALRQIPSMRAGTIGISLYVPSANTTDYVFELKHAYNYTYGEFTLAGFAVKPDGTVYLCDGEETVVGTVEPDSWNDYAIEFDMLGTKKGTLLVNGASVATFDLNIQSDRITVVELSESAATATTGSVIYADDFYAVEAADVAFASSAPITTKAVTVQAFRPYRDGQITVDGAVSELYWLLDTPVGDAGLGALCDGSGVYLAFETQASIAVFTVNGIETRCYLGSAPTASLGTIAGKSGVYELHLTYAQLGMDPVVSAQLSFDASIGYYPVTGTLVLSSCGLTPTGSGLALTGTDYHSAYKGDSTGNITVSEDGVFTFKNDGASNYYYCYTKSASDWANLSLPGLSMSFEADFNDLPSSTTRSNMHWFGLWWFIVDNDCRYDMAFWADADRQIRFTVHQDTNAAARDNALATGIYLGRDEAQNVRVRILVDTDHNVTLYLNGVRCGTLSANPGIPSGASSLSFNTLWFYADHRNRESVDHSVDVTISDFSVKELAGTEPMVAVEVFKETEVVPKAEGQVFGGFYSDTDHTSAYRAETGYAYTKFVPEKVLSVKAQISAGITAQSEKADMRFLTTVDSLLYREVGFYFTMNGTTQKIRSSTVYSKILATSDGVPFPHAPTIFHELSSYFMTYTIRNIPQNQFDSDITITPYWVTLDGTECKGVTNTLRVSMGYASKS